MRRLAHRRHPAFSPCSIAHVPSAESVAHALRAYLAAGPPALQVDAALLLNEAGTECRLHGGAPARLLPLSLPCRSAPLPSPLPPVRVDVSVQIKVQV
jgi:hypothetical protein